MAKPKVKPAARRAQRQAVKMRRLLVLDALRSGVVSVVALGAIFLLWVLYNAELLATEPALTITAIVALFIALHSGLRSFLNESTRLPVAAGVGVFAVVWMVAIAWPLQKM